MNIDIDSLTIGQARDLFKMFGGTVKQPTEHQNHPFEIGRNYLIRTVTHYHTGKLVEVYPTELVLEDAAWICDTGRFSDSLKSCDFNEVEPFNKGRVIIGRQAIIDASEIENIPTTQK